MIRIICFGVSIFTVGCLMSTEPERRVHLIECQMVDDSVEVYGPPQTFSVKDGKCVLDSI